MYFIYLLLHCSERATTKNCSHQTRCGGDTNCFHRNILADYLGRIGTASEKLVSYPHLSPSLPLSSLYPLPLLPPFC